MLLVKEDREKILCSLAEILKNATIIADADSVPEYQLQTDGITVHALKIARMIDPLGAMKVEGMACGYGLDNFEEDG